MDQTMIRSLIMRSEGGLRGGEEETRPKRPKFKGIELSDPQYYALKNEAIALDRDLKRLAMENSLGALIRNPYLVKSVLVIRLVPLVPEDIKQENQQVA